jgi:solute carrier family 31 (copper transporter), member 1
MGMFFHSNVGRDNLWLSSWMPSTVGATVGACIGLFIISLLYRLLYVFRCVLERVWAAEAMVAEASEYTLNKSPSNRKTLKNSAPFRYNIEIIRAILHMFYTAIGYLLMLAVMTFNVWFCECPSISCLRSSLIFVSILHPGSGRCRRGNLSWRILLW